MLGLQLVLFCLLYIGMVKIAVKDSGLNCLYFYPDAFLDEAEKRGIADKEATKKKGKRFMLWVGRSKIWKIKGMEDVPYKKPVSYMLKRRTLGTVAYLVIAVFVAGLAVLIGLVL